MREIFLKNKHIIIFPLSHNVLVDTLNFTINNKQLLDNNNLFLVEYNKHNYLKDKNKIKKNSVYYLLKKLEKLNIEYSFLDVGAQKQHNLFINNSSWRELLALYLFSFYKWRNRLLIKNKFPSFYKYILKDREEIMMKKIKEKLVNSSKNLVIIVGKIHYDELFNRMRLLKHVF